MPLINTLTVSEIVVTVLHEWPYHASFVLSMLLHDIMMSLLLFTGRL